MEERRGEAASLREAPPPEPLSRRAAGNKLVFSFGVERPCELGAFSYGWVEVTAADRAAAPSQLEGNGKMQRILPTSRPQTRPTPHGRGGSVSRRDLNQATGNRAHFTGGTKSAKSHKPNATCSSGEGVWGRGASLREAASPPESPTHRLFGRAREGGGFLSKKPPPSQLLTH